MRFWPKKQEVSNNVTKEVTNNSAPAFVPVGLQWLLQEIGNSPVQWYLTNPILNAVINKRASYLCNARFKVVNVNTGRDIKNDKLLTKLENPNSFQSRNELLKSFAIFCSCYGTSYVSGVSEAVGFEKNLDYGQLVSLMPENIIINQRQISLFNYDYTISYNDFGKENKIDKENCYPIFDTTTGITQQGYLQNIVGMMSGVSRCQSLKTNIQTLNDAFKARGIIAQTPGGLWMVSANPSANDLIGFSKTEKQSVEKNLSETYGVSKAKAQLISTSAAVVATKLSIPYVELGLDPIIAGETDVVLSVFNMPKDLFTSKASSSLSPDSLTAVEVAYYQDEITPLADNICNTISEFYGYNKLGKKLVATFDHLPIFQENLKSKATVLLQVANSISKLTDLTPEQRMQILVNYNIINDPNNE